MITQNTDSVPKTSSDPLSIALAGNPNCGKTALFNALTGGKQKVGNYPGVTVERKEGALLTRSGQKISLLDLPGTYSLDARTPDERVTRDVILGAVPDERLPQVLVAVADATNLERNLGLVLELKALGRPIVLALNMMDLARARGMEIDLSTLARELGIRVVPIVAVTREGLPVLMDAVENTLSRGQMEWVTATDSAWRTPDASEVRARFAEVDRILRLAVTRKPGPTLWTDRIDRLVLHPIAGTLFLFFVLALMFQAIFAWAGPPADAIEAGVASFGEWVGSGLTDGALRSLLVDGVISGVGSVLVFLPQILFLFLFILVLEDSGYMARAAVLMDKVMGKVGLHGRAFIPLLSSYACAIPGIMATRTIDNKRDRLTTILIAPLTTCSARLPVYTLLVAAFIPNRDLGFGLGLQGVVMFGLYVAGLLLALMVGYVLKRTAFKGQKAPLLLELPTYKLPSIRSVTIGLIERSKTFVRRAGTVILSLSVLLWFLASYPKQEDGSHSIHSSYAGQIGHALEPFIRPLGYDWRIGVALIPGFAAREVMVSALSTVYAIELSEGTPSSSEEPLLSEEQQEQKEVEALGKALAGSWSLATALSLLMWYIIAPQCISTLAVVRRETNSWRWPLVVLIYLTSLAYFASWLTYRFAVFMGWG